MTPPPMMIFDPFDLIVVPFPFVNSLKTKPRPALVLSTRDFNHENRHSVLAMVTRATHSRWPSDHEILELQPTGLHAASVVRFKIFTLDNRILQRRIGRLSERDVRVCVAALEAMFSHRH